MENVFHIETIVLICISLPCLFGFFFFWFSLWFIYDFAKFDRIHGMDAGIHKSSQQLNRKDVCVYIIYSGKRLNRIRGLNMERVQVLYG